MADVPVGRGTEALCYSLAAVLLGIVRTMRPHQWVKNLFVVAPLVFAKELFDVPAALKTLVAFVLFCLASSTVYLINDLADVEADRAHPIKRARPIASGQVSLSAARTAAVACGLAAVVGGLILSVTFWGVIVAYLLLNIAYSARLKRVAYLDVLCIAAGFELRVVGGAVSAAVPPSAYLLVVTFLLASFLGFGKRMHELGQAGEDVAARKALRGYHEKGLGVLLYVTAVATAGTYVLYTLDPRTRSYFGTDYLVVTTFFTLYGLFRFVQLIRSRPDSESPTEEMLRDKPFLANLTLWAAAVVIVIYLGSPAG